MAIDALRKLANANHLINLSINFLPWGESLENTYVIYYLSIFSFYLKTYSEIPLKPQEKVLTSWNINAGLKHSPQRRNRHVWYSHKKLLLREFTWYSNCFIHIICVTLIKVKKIHLNSTEMKFTWKFYMNFVSVDNFHVNFTCSNFTYVIMFNLTKNCKNLQISSCKFHNSGNTAK